MHRIQKIFVLLFALTTVWTFIFLILSYFNFDSVIDVLEIIFTIDGKIEAEKLVWAWVRVLFAPYYILLLTLGIYKVITALPTLSPKFVLFYSVILCSHYLVYVYQYDLLGSAHYEDDVLEWGTALLAFISAIIFLAATFLGGRLTLLLAAAMFIFAMEEISWGQRIFSIEVSGIFQTHNYQNELNIHNFLNPVLFHLYSPFFLFLTLLLTYFRKVKIFKVLYDMPTSKIIVSSSDKYHFVYPLLFYSVFAMRYFGQAEFLEQQFSIFCFAFSIVLLKEFVRAYKTQSANRFLD